MTIPEIKAHTVAFVSKMAAEGAEPADTLTAVNLLIGCTLKSTPAHARAKVAGIYFESIKESI
ncbi:MAG: hypothetical protein V4510_09840 [bacterium]